MEGRFPNRWLPYVLVLPSVAIVVVFLLVPSGQALYLSLFELSPFGGRANFIGLGNFQELLGSKEYRHSVQVSLLFAGAVVLSGMVVSLGIAVLANQRIPGITIYRTALLWPYALSPAVAGTVWAMLFDPSTGFMTFLIRMTTGLSPNWMMDGAYAMTLAVAAAAWKMLGFNIVFFLAGLQGIPGELLEAAHVDGASLRQSFLRITFPLLSPMTFFLLVMNSLYAFFEVFGLIDVMTQGGPARATDLLIYKLYRDGFVSIRWGFASAQSVLLFVMVGLLTLLQFRYAGRRVFYS
ncbi:MAG: sugar ABC transporter permease [Planctomycetes bacterium]|nr:sugar ABC transporter permease [Planctomycetota bacterium]MBI3455754.1 sugar ABC transporter permease [Candidatus Rokubacteria bacterium]